jgi:hypothetical protein
MTKTTTRQSFERRQPDRRSFEFSSLTANNRRATSRRDIMDRRDDPFWRFSWLRTALVQHLTC